MEEYVKKLFIIGNGFDLAHNLPTRYLDYRNYLFENPDTRDFLMRMEEAYGLSDSSDTWWKDFECNLGEGSIFESDFETMAYSAVDEMIDDEGEPMPDVESTLEIHFKPYYEFMEQLNNTVMQWVNTINLAPVRKITKRITNRDALYFSFNYTNVLESVYGIDYNRVFHVHGSVLEHHVIMGHGNMEAVEQFRKEADEAVERLEKNLATIKSGIYSFYKASYKDTKTIIEQNQGVFNSYREIGEIHIYGHSMGDVDKPYFKEIKKHSLPNSDWYIYIYCDDTSFVKEKADWTKKMEFLNINRKHLHIIKASRF